MFWGKVRRPLAALDRCTLNKGAFAFKISRGALKWPLKGGSRLIEVAATAGLTVVDHGKSWKNHGIVFFLISVGTLSSGTLSECQLVWIWTVRLS